MSLDEPENTDTIGKLENKVKLSNLLTGKKFADLELNIGKLEGRLNEFSADFTKIKERSEEIEDILNVVNLGIGEYKEKLEEIGSQVPSQNIPADLEKKMTDYQNRLNSLDNNVKNILETIDSLKNIKEQLKQSMGETFIQSIENLKRNSEKNKNEMEYIKKDLDAFSSAIKSFERNLELMNVDSLTKRFQSADNRMTNIQSEIQEFRGTLNNLTFSAEDLKVLKNQVNSIDSSLNEKLNKINELEKGVKTIRQKIDDVNYFSVSKGKENSFDVKDVRIDELTTRVDKLSEEIMKLSPRERIESGENPSIDSSEIEEIYTKVKGMYDEISGKISELKDLEEKIKPREDVMESQNLTHDAARTFAKLNERIILLEKRHNELVDLLQAELQAMRDFTPSKNGVSNGNLLKQVDEIEKALISRDKNFDEYSKQVDKRFKTVENMKFSGLPKDLIEEFNLMKETVTRLSTENQELRKLGRVIRISQLESINLQTFNALTEKVGLLERKLSEIEENMTKEIFTQTQKGEILENLRKEIEDSKKILESKIIEVESSREVIKNKVSEIEKKMKEEDIIKPIILE